MELHRGINFSRLEVPADAGGLIFVVGSVVALLIGVPLFRVFILGALMLGLASAWLLFRWHEAHARPIDLRPIGLDFVSSARDWWQARRKS